MVPLARVFAVVIAFAIPSLAAEFRTVREFGAIGDGAADDTAAIQRAADSGAVFFPKGTYRLTKTVTVELDRTGFSALSSDGTARIVMEAAGPAFHFVGTHEGSADPGSFKPNVWERQRMPMVDRLEIVGAHAEADGIGATETMQLTITATTVRNVRHAIHLTRRNRNVLIADCHLFHNRGCGVFLDEVNEHQTNVVGSHISYNAGGGVVTRGGEVRNLQISGCDIESNMTPDGPRGANVLIDSTGGSTDEVSITGCTIQHNSKSPGSANIRFVGQGITSLKDPTPTQEGHLVITGNIFSDVAVNIDLQHARGVTVTGNTFWEGFEKDIVVTDSQAVVIGANDFDRNPRYVVNGNWGKDRGGILLQRCEDSKLQGFLLKGVWGQPAAVMLDNCKRCTVQDCSILDSDGIGLWLKDSARCQISGCVIRDDREEKKATVSLKQEGSKENWILGNWLADGTDGMSDADTRLNRR